jgi:formylglycine-generating enzyme required for sulfatase activity
MFYRHALIVASFVVALTPNPALAHESDEKRDWNKFPAIIELTTSEDVYALGDVHGDYDRCADLLVACNILEKKPADPNDPAQVKWKAGKAILVCMGDMIDKGPESVKVLMLMRSLQEAAKNEGGRVVITYGNHEAEFLGSPVLDPTNNPDKHTFDKKLDEFIVDLKRTTFNGAALNPDQVVDGKDPAGLGAFLRSLPFAVVVNDWFFSHASDTGKKPIVQLRDEIMQGVNDKTKGYDPAKTEAIRGLLDARLSDGKKGTKPPMNWWEEPRTQGQTGEDGLRRYTQILQNTARSQDYRVRHLVMGHQKGKVHFIEEPTSNDRGKGQLFEKFNGLIFFIDVGMSRWVEDENQGTDAGAASKGFMLLIRDTPEPQAFRLDHTGKRVDLAGNSSNIPLWRAGFVRLPKATCYLGWNPPLLRDGVNESVQTQIKDDFEIAINTVTQGQWQEVMGNNPSAFSSTGVQKDKVKGMTEEDLKRFPVESVSWDDAQEFIKKLNEGKDKYDYIYRLPTEAEWEYACRGGATSQNDGQHHFYFTEPTDKLSSDQANFNGDLPDGDAPKGPYLARTTKVGSYPPNKLGLYDMHGNVRQWCQDLNEHYGFGREVRGGGWDDPGRGCRAGFRAYAMPTDRVNHIGFRLVRTHPAALSLNN